MTPVTPIELPIRGKLLNDARDLTCGEREKQYGDPLAGFEAIVGIKNAFWDDNAHHEIGKHTLFGHAMDMLFTKLGRIASAPTLESALSEDNFLDAINYLALAYEVAKRSIPEK